MCKKDISQDLKDVKMDLKSLIRKNLLNGAYLSANKKHYIQHPKSQFVALAGKSSPLLFLIFPEKDFS